jgi:hypothetical protein
MRAIHPSAMAMARMAEAAMEKNSGTYSALTPN